MAEEVWKYLQHVPNPNKKPNPTLKRKSEVTDKEVLNLTGGLYPLKLVDSVKNVLLPSRSPPSRKWTTGSTCPSGRRTRRSGPSTTG